MSRICRRGLCAAITLLSAAAVWAQGASRESKADAQPVGMVEQPCPPPISPPAAVRDLLVELFIEPRTLTAADFDRLMKNPQFMTFNEESRRLAVQDWPGVCRYRAANVAVARVQPAPRIVFMGDSITENWGLADPTFFSGGIVNRGIGGQTTAQMLVRFRADVVALRPQAVHIVAGTNDVAGNTGPTSPQDFENNIMSMAEIARANGIRVILGAIPPAAAFNWRPQIKPVPTIRALNDWLRGYAARNQIEFIDYYTALAGPSGELKPDLGNDGVHPNGSGYRAMRSLVEKAVPSAIVPKKSGAH
jgi:lysophospholipase L1-like esterase